MSTSSSLPDVLISVVLRTLLGYFMTAAVSKDRYVDDKFFLTVLVGFSRLSAINRRFLDYYILEVTVHTNSRLSLPVLSL